MFKGIISALVVVAVALVGFDAALARAPGAAAAQSEASDYGLSASCCERGSMDPTACLGCTSPCDVNITAQIAASPAWGEPPHGAAPVYGRGDALVPPALAAPFRPPRSSILG